MTTNWDCVVVGGGAAGLSAALTLGRARRSTLIVDAGEQSNRPAPGIGGLLGFDGRPPAELYAVGRRELAEYPSIEIRSGTVQSARVVGAGFELRLDDGTSVQARRMLLATGMQYRPPALPGVSELWGNSVFHCPFCHGWEVRDQPLSAVADGDRGVHAALLLRGWTDDVVLLTNGPANLNAEQHALLRKADVTVDERVITEFVGRAGQLAEVRFAEGVPLPRRGAMLATTMQQRSDLARQLGVRLAEPNPMVADGVLVDALGRTNIDGVFAAGDTCAQMPQVSLAVAAGSLAGAAIVQSLLADDVGLPFPPRATSEEVDVQQMWEDRYAESERMWSGRPNDRLVEIVSELPPGRALDLGCGEGGDTVWLAQRGWQVLAVDIANRALDRARESAGELVDRIEFQRHDLTKTFPSGTFDLVSAHFLHSPIDWDRNPLMRRAADAVAPGGTLLIVDHGAAPPWAGQSFAEHAHHHEFPSPQTVVAGMNLSPTEWDTIRVEQAERVGVAPDGRSGTLIDNVIVLRRR